ncbi:MAG: hypothetical protein AAF744_01360 [Pseudomonadota bacterium]
MAKKANKRKQAQAVKAAAAPVTRRNMLKLVRNGALAGLALTGAGYAGARMFSDYKEMHDLARIGQGKPAVVQVHDPQCPTCTALQREAKRAMQAFGECDLIYLVADLRQAEGAAFATRHGVGRVTLLLLDGRGQVTSVLQGMRQEEELAGIFAGHFRRHGVRRS